MRSVVLLALFCTGISAKSQFIEFGGGFGALNYSGDLIRGYQISNLKPGISGHYRMNFSQYVSLNWGLTVGKLTGSDSKPIDAFAGERNASFSITMAELSSVVEYHFLDYKHEKSIIKWSPYAFLGVGFTRIYGADHKNGDFNKIQAVVPLGIGFKHLIGKRFSAGIEFGFRKTFFDLLDTISDNDVTLKDYQYGNPNDNDWYYFTGLSLSFVLYEIPCPFPYVPNRHMLKANFR